MNADYISRLARELTDSEPDRNSKMRALVDELHRRWSGVVDADDACLFVIALAVSVGIRCRFVAARFGPHSWTCFVAYETEDGRWETVDPLRQKVT